jgi:hypothetical protein
MMIWLKLLLSIASAGWLSGQVHVTDHGSSGPTAIYINTYQPQSPIWPPGQWSVIDVDQIGNEPTIPRSAKALELHGILIITRGRAMNETCGMTVVFRPYGSQISPGNYTEQMIVPPLDGGGARQNTSTWVPLKDGKFEFYWTRSTQGQWPEHCSYGLNLTVQAYLD